MHNKIKKTSFIVLGFLTLLTVAFSYRHIQIVRAEQGGGSPNSGATSRLVTLSTALTSLSYGSTAAGAWGDWGTSWNRIYSAASNSFNDAKAVGTKNGGGSSPITGCTSGLNCYPQSVGGVDDYNAAGTTPSDAYKKTWIACDVAANTPSHPGGNYCGTGRSVAEKMDPNTGLVWSPSISAGLNWFQANNCDNTQAASCTANGQAACICTKLASSKTGCEGYDDGSWRLPYQKELMQSYIDGSWANLTNAANYYWSSTTLSTATQYSWLTYQTNGLTVSTNKTGAYSVRCVR